jgi:hypothetical protein
MSEWNYIIAAYVLTWVVLGAFALYVRRRVARAESAWRADAGGASRVREQPAGSERR